MNRWKRPLLGGTLLAAIAAGGVAFSAKPADACDRCGHYGRHCLYRAGYYDDYRPAYYGRRIRYYDAGYDYGYRHYPRYRRSHCEDDDDD